ncbi:MAG: ATP-binding cassette domain-containing protein [Candidatus Dormibacteria bacterium]
MPNDMMIEAEELAKRYGETQALAGVDFAVPGGNILGLLGPNGAGKTTAVRILTTLALPDAGRARVAGVDVVGHPAEVRRHIGVAAQDATLDELLTGRQNLVLIGELSDMGRWPARQRATQLLAQFELTDAADRVMKGYSGGMRRRLDLAAALMTRPPVLFLDEPTTGLDPVSRQRVWEAVRELTADGVTVLLTTQYLDEADRLADTIVVIDRGLVVAEGTPEQLKASIGRPVVRVTLPDADPGVVERVRQLLGEGAEVRGRSVSAPAPRGLTGLEEVVARLRAMGVAVHEVGLEHPSLDEVFSTVTDHSGHPDEPSSAAAGGA